MGMADGGGVWACGRCQCQIWMPKNANRLLLLLWLWLYAALIDVPGGKSSPPSPLASPTDCCLLHVTVSDIDFHTRAAAAAAASKMEKLLLLL